MSTRRARNDRADVLFGRPTSCDVPEFLRAVDFFEWCGILSRADARAWRERFAARFTPYGQVVVTRGAPGVPRTP